MVPMSAVKVEDDCKQAMHFLTLAADAGCFHDAGKADQMDHIADLNILATCRNIRHCASGSPTKGDEPRNT